MKLISKNYFIFSTLLALFLISCNSHTEKQKKETESDTIPATKEGPEEKPKPVFKTTFHIDSIENKTAIDSFKLKYPEEFHKIIYALNRIDPHRVEIGLKLVVPDSLVADFKLYAPFPKEFHDFDSIPKTVLIAKRIQAFALYENGKLQRWGPISTGKQSTGTPSGLYYGNYKAKRKISTIDDSWVMPYYFNFMNFEGIGTHQYTLPGMPASHGCVRMYKEDARFIYDWAKMWELEKDVIVKNGTPFMVFGEYNFETSAPWLALADHMEANNLNDAEMATLKNYASSYKNDPLNLKKEELPEEQLIL